VEALHDSLVVRLHASLFNLLLILMKLIISISLLLSIGGPLWAQNPAPSVRGEVARRDSSQTVWTPGMTATTEPTLGQDQEIYLLQQSQPFYVRSTTTPVYTTNAFYDFTGLDDWYVSNSIDFGMETIIADRYYFMTEVGGSMVRYDQFDLLDRETLSAKVALNAAVGETTSIGIGYDTIWYFDRGFKNNDSTFQTVTLNANWVHPLSDGAFLALSPSVSRVWSSPGDYDQTVFGLDSQLIIPVSEKTAFGLTGRVSYSDYDHFYESVFNESRQDLTLGASAFLSIRLRDNIEIRPEIIFMNNNSSLTGTDLFTGSSVDLYDYDAWTILPTLSISVHF